MVEVRAAVVPVRVLQVKAVRSNRELVSRGPGVGLE